MLIHFREMARRLGILPISGSGNRTSTVPVGSAKALSNATTSDITSISLPAGEWDVSGHVNFSLTGATSTLHASGISLTSATLPPQAGGSGLGPDALTQFPLPTTVLTSTYSQKVGPVRVSLAAQTTVYLVAQSTFSVGSEAAYGSLFASAAIG